MRDVLREARLAYAAGAGQRQQAYALLP